MIMTRSTPSTPICNPQLPPVIAKKAGALQRPLAVRQVATPLPPSAPNTNPPLIMWGTTAMHFACSSTSSGIPLSGAAITSCRTAAALSSRSVVASFRSSAQLMLARLITASVNIIFFIAVTFRFDLQDTHLRGPRKCQGEGLGPCQLGFVLYNLRRGAAWGLTSPTDWSDARRIWLPEASDTEPHEPRSAGESGIVCALCLIRCEA